MTSSTRADGATELLDLPTSGRRFSTTRKVRLGDTTPKGRLRLDAVARFLQDVANDDARDAALPDAMWWILRRTKMVVVEPCAFDDQLTITTWCSGSGGRWAERRTRLESPRGGLIETVSVWVSIDSDTGAPKRLDPMFHEVWGTAAAGRTVRARLLHGDPSGELVERPWTVRFADLDLMGHVNNAVYWAAVEESMARHRTGGRVTAEVEFRDGVDAHTAPALVEAERPDGVDGWFVLDGGAAASYSWTAVEGSAVEGNTAER